MDLAIFSSRLKQLIDSHGTNGKEVAPEIGISEAAVSRYLRMLRIPDVNSIIKIAEYFNVSTDWLLGMTDDPYDTFASDIREFVSLYKVASEDDKYIISAVLKKYKNKE